MNVKGCFDQNVHGQKYLYYLLLFLLSPPMRVFGLEDTATHWSCSLPGLHQEIPLITPFGTSQLITFIQSQGLTPTVWPCLGLGGVGQMINVVCITDQYTVKLSTAVSERFLDWRIWRWFGLALCLGYIRKYHGLHLLFYANDNLYPYSSRAKG